MSDEPEVAASGTRREGRERILGLLYEAELKGVGIDELIEGLPLPVRGYAAAISNDIGPSLDSIDELIEEASHRWKLARMPAIDRALLRMATYELVHRPDVPAGAIISEAVELAAVYSTDSSSRFVNGVLGRLAFELRPDETALLVEDAADAIEESPSLGVDARE